MLEEADYPKKDVLMAALRGVIPEVPDSSREIAMTPGPKILIVLKEPLCDPNNPNLIVHEKPYLYTDLERYGILHDATATTVAESVENILNIRSPHAGRAAKTFVRRRRRSRAACCRAS